MPIKKLVRTSSGPLGQTLRTALADEWKSPSNSPDQPIIIQDGGSNNKPLHLYVVWDKWADLDQIERSEIIMDVFEEIHGSDAALSVTVAMGLTHREAQRMGISYQ